MAGAQQAYSALQRLVPKEAQNNESSSTSNPIGSDFNALGQALQSGDLSSAQSASSQLQNDLKSQNQDATANGTTQGIRHHHHHVSKGHDGDFTSSSSSSSMVTTGRSGFSGSNGQIVNTLA